MARLLVIDRNTEVVDNLCVIAKILGHSIYHCEEWNKQCHNNLANIDVILLDLHIAGENSFKLLDELAEFDLPPIVLIAEIESNVIDATIKIARSKGVNVVLGLSKPVKLEELSAALSMINRPAQQESTEQNRPLLPKETFDIVECMEKDYFSVVYQPQFNPLDRTISGVECLSRLSLPGLGPIPPPVFIEALETNNLVSKFTLLMIEKALGQLSALYSLGHQFTTAFNVSAHSLNEEFKDQLFTLLDRFEVPANLLTIEITETSAIHINANSVSVLTEMRIKGLNLSLDDFGTGYSTIRQLNELPFNEIKVDRCFVNDIGRKKSAEAIISATVELADTIDYVLVCEGVETQQQLDFLLNLNCMIFQGFLFSKPLELNALIELLEQSEKLTTHLNYWQHNDDIAQRIISENMHFKCVQLNSDNHSLIRHLRNILERDIVVPFASINTLNWGETELLIVAGANNVKEIQDVMKAVKCPVMVLYRDINREELVSLFKLGVADAIDAKSLPHEVLYRIYTLVQYNRKIRTFEMEHLSFVKERELQLSENLKKSLSRNLEKEKISQVMQTFEELQRLSNSPSVH